jgi:hypothetical protein
MSSDPIVHERDALASNVASLQRERDSLLTALSEAADLLALMPPCPEHGAMCYAHMEVWLTKMRTYADLFPDVACPDPTKPEE